MKDYFKIAWRNLWRNKRRTLITASSILFAVFFAIVMRSFQLGTYDHMIKNTIESFMGFLQIQHVDYQDEMVLDNSFEYTTGLLSKLEGIEGIKAVVPRIESFALASTGNQTKGVLVLGIDPVKEEKLTNPGERLVRYRLTEQTIDRVKEAGLPSYIVYKMNLFLNNSYSSFGRITADLKLTEDDIDNYGDLIKKTCSFYGKTLVPGDDGVLVSDRLSKFLKLNVGDTLILMSQGYHGVSAAGLFPVRGIVKIPAPDIDNKLVFMPLPKAQEFYGMYNRLTSITINPVNNDDSGVQSMKTRITHVLNNDKLTVRTWQEFNKVLLQQIQGDSQTGQVILGLLYFIIFFGIFGTVLMMIHERLREFGVLISIGMKRGKLAIIMVIEMLFIGLLGVVTGVILSLPILYLGNIYPIHFTGDLAKVYEDMGFEAIMPLAWIDWYIFWQGFIVALMVVLASIYPLRKIFKLKEVEALRA